MKCCVPWLFALVILGVISLESACAGEITIDARGWNYYPLEFSQLVVVGVIVDVRDEEVLGTDLRMVPLGTTAAPLHVRAKRVTLDIQEVWRGRAPSGGSLSVLVAMFDKDFNTPYPVGETVLMGLNWHPRLQTYYLKSTYGKYLSRSGAWVCEVPSAAARVFDDKAMRQIVSATDIEHVTAAAEVIVVGRVKRAEETKTTVQDGSVCMMMSVTLEDVRGIKGKVADNEIQFRFITKGTFWSSERKETPRVFEPGQTWYAYLKRGDSGWYPFAGSNGLFLVDGERLTYEAFGLRMDYWRSRDVVDRIAGVAVEEK
ncbi:MAG TPA: hypothetical protein VFX92_02520 [Candidatus Krumholzibacteria bacterium]|nr:hypothetical protein [Candidatus Krumholzibacteria bacterium]